MSEFNEGDRVRVAESDIGNESLFIGKVGTVSAVAEEGELIDGWPLWVLLDDAPVMPEEFADELGDWDGSFGFEPRELVKLA